MKVNPDSPQAEARELGVSCTHLKPSGNGNSASTSLLFQIFYDPFLLVLAELTSSQYKVRATVLRSGKMLLVPQPRRGPKVGYATRSDKFENGK